MPFIVLKKHPPWPEMHVLPNGNLSFYGSPKRFFSKEAAADIAREWAQIDANCDLSGSYVIRRVE